MHNASAYQALAQELERWRSIPFDQLVARVGEPASVKYATIDGEEIAIEVSLHWHERDRTAIRVAGAANGPSHWRLERLESMSKRIKYSDEPIQAEVVRDFRPSPDELLADDEGVKVTISLSRRSVDFFKAAAERKHTSYQIMIRRLLDRYADQYRGDLAMRSSGRSRNRAAQR